MLKNEDGKEYDIEENEDNIIVLTDDEGQDIPFELLDIIEHGGQRYIVILPVDEDSEVVTILRIENSDNHFERYSSIDDEEIIENIFNIFKDKNSGIFNFEE